ncbi:MAG TPA: PQQ-dependent sugar dehydrogenase [Thermoanaerobaculia bacterium]
MKPARFFPFLLLLSLPTQATTLPGFRIEQVADVPGSLTSLVTDSHGTIYYTEQSGEIMRAGAVVPLAHVNTDASGDAGLLGLALIDDETAVVHYTTPMQAYHVVSRIDLRNGSESNIHTFVSDITNPGASVSSEHHGGNPIFVDGTIYFGIGDFGIGRIASDPAWNGGKLFRIDPDGTVTKFASGFRNPFDMAWDPAGKRVVLTDNGDVTDDEINVVPQSGGFFGWPCTAGDVYPPCDGAIPPLYSFPTVVAPTGIVRLSGANPLIKRGYLLGAYVTRALYYIPDIDARPFPDPIVITMNDVAQVIDVTESPTGEIYFATRKAIYRLIPPPPGDCNGDGVVDFNDLTALQLQLAAGDGVPAYRASSWGCDADADGVITWNDYGVLRKSLITRTRAVRH